MESIRWSCYGNTEVGSAVPWVMTLVIDLSIGRQECGPNQVIVTKHGAGHGGWPPGIWWSFGGFKLGRNGQITLTAQDKVCPHRITKIKRYLGHCIRFGNQFVWLWQLVSRTTGASIPVVHPRIVETSLDCQLSPDQNLGCTGFCPQQKYCSGWQVSWATGATGPRQKPGVNPKFPHS